MKKITYKTVKTAKELQSAFLVRQIVFTKEQKINANEDLDENDAYATHFIALDESKNTIGTVRLFYKKDCAKVGRLAVLKNFRGKGVGFKLMKLAIMHSKKDKAKKIIANCQCQAIPFYESLGFKKRGEIFLEVEIPHIMMELQL